MWLHVSLHNKSSQNTGMFNRFKIYRISSQLVRLSFSLEVELTTPTLFSVRRKVSRIRLLGPYSDTSYGDYNPKLMVEDLGSVCLAIHQVIAQRFRVTLTIEKNKENTEAANLL